MPIAMPWGGQKKTLEQSQEENEQLEVQLSIEQKKAAIKRLQAAGLTGKSFGWNWHSITAWLRTH